MSISLALYEKAIPAGKSFEEMFEITKACGFDRFEISIDETDARLQRLEMSAAEQSELGALARRSGTPIRTMCLSGHRKYPLGASDPQVRERSMDIMKKAVDLSDDLDPFSLRKKPDLSREEQSDVVHVFLFALRSY